MRNKILSILLISGIIACGETPGTGTDATDSPGGPSNANSFRDSSGTASTDSSQITVMSADSSQLNSSSDSARKNQGR